MHAWLCKTLAILALAVPLTGCVNTGSVTPTHPLSAPLSAAKGWTVATTRVPDGEAYLDTIKLELDRALREEKVVAETAEGGLTFEVVVVDLDTGNKTARYMNTGGEAEISLEVTITEADGSKVAQLTVLGNSARQAETSVGGVKTSANDNRVKRAIDAAIEQLVDYLEEPAQG